MSRRSRSSACFCLGRLDTDPFCILPHSTIMLSLRLFPLVTPALNAHRKNDAGGWWNLTTGAHPSAPETSEAPAEAVPFGTGTSFESSPGSAGEQLSSRIAELAEQLGITDPSDLASAIKPLVHPTKASAILDAEPEETGVAEDVEKGEGGEEKRLVDIIVEDEREKRKLLAKKQPLGWMEAAVGMDEPPSEMPV